MARLSVEHFKSNPSTPQPERKTSRLRDMFKPCSSSSASTSPTVVTKSQPASSANASPLMQPSIKPGYEKIGILPSERSSFETARQIHDEAGGKTLGEILNDEAQNYPPRSSSTAGAAMTPGKNDTQGLDRKHEFTDEDESSSLFPGSSISTDIELGSSPPAAGLARMDIDDSYVTPFKRFRLTTAASAYAPPADPRSPTHATNLSTANDALTQDIRDYITTQIAHALAEHDATAQSTTIAQSTFKALLQYNMGPISLSSVPRTIGPFSISHVGAATLVQPLVLLVFGYILFEAAVSGPKTLFLVLWRGAVVLGVYAVALRWLEWNSDIFQDMLVSPILWSAQRLQVWAAKMSAADREKMA